MIKKIHLINFLQILMQIACLIFGFFYEPKSTIVTVPQNVLGIMTKVQTTNTLQNFFWCFTNNLSISFIIFWLNYWSFGIIGTLWCMITSFMVGSLIKFSLIINSWLSICFMALEIIVYVFVMLSSTRFKFNKKLEKHKKQKDILKVMTVITIILIIAAIIEAIAINFMRIHI